MTMFAVSTFPCDGIGEKAAILDLFYFYESNDMF